MTTLFTQPLTLDELPQSLGAFKPVGHVMVAVADDEVAQQAVQALKEEGFADQEILYFGAGQGHERMHELIEHSSDVAGFGYEITLMRRYKKLAAQGYRWLLVYAPDDEQTQQVAKLAERFNAPMAVKYNRLVIEDLI